MGTCNSNKISSPSPMDQPKLQTPKFIKIKQIKPGKHCYNVYVTIRKIENNEVTRYDGTCLKMAEGLLADDTGCANFRFVGDWVNTLQEGKTYAIRNGRSEVVQEHLR